MDRGVWWDAIHGVARVVHNLVTKPPSPPPPNSSTIQALLILTISQGRNYYYANFAYEETEVQR